MEEFNDELSKASCLTKPCPAEKLKNLSFPASFHNAKKNVKRTTLEEGWKKEQELAIAKEQIVDLKAQLYLRQNDVVICEKKEAKIRKKMQKRMIFLEKKACENKEWESKYANIVGTMRHTEK